MKKREKTTRDPILANFQFYIDDNSKEIFEGMTMNISQSGFGFITNTTVKEGQSITIINLTKRSNMRDFTDQQAKVIWVKEGCPYSEAGVKFHSER